MYNVLIVDDEEIIREGLGLLVDWPSLGFEIGGHASNGQEALSCLTGEAGGFDLILTDIRMPVLDGLEFIRTLRATAPTIKIIIISGYNEFTYAQQAISLGVKGFLLKPIDRLELTGLLISVKEELDENRSSLDKASSANSLLQNRFLYDLIHGNLTEDEMVAGRQPGWVDLQGTRYVSALVKIADMRKMVEESLEKAKTIRKSVLSICMQKVGSRDSGAVYEEDDGLIGILFRQRETVLSSAVITAVLKEILETVHVRLAIRASAAFGESVEKIALLKESRLQAEESLERLLFAGDSDETLCIEASRSSRDLSAKVHPKLIDQVADYVDQHYMEDITLKSVSQHFFMNTSYLGQIFKSATSESFNNYLNKRRITEAKKMIRADHLKISMIVDKIGYKNTQHFYKQFRKYEGLSVQEYKRRHLQTESP